MRAAFTLTAAVAIVLAGATTGQPTGLPADAAARKATCSVNRALFDVMFMQLSTASWGGFVCADGTFEVSAYDLKKVGRLPADRLAELRRLVATLPVEKTEYNFGEYSPDVFELYVWTNLGGRRSYNVFLRAERSPAVSAIFAAAQILRETFESKWAQPFAPPAPPQTPTPN
ncbi:MAG: hypothetical protein K1Y01_00605 [Vicinamibacteria bacterium]|nr:hypothetical protein [Vicinamibacteria bacterium]